MFQTCRFLLVTLPDFLHEMPDTSDIFIIETFCYGDVLFRRRCVSGNVVLRRCSVTVTFCMETLCGGDVDFFGGQQCH
jgi:hypothetical protein